MAIILLITTEDGQVNELPVLSKIIMGRSSTSDYKITDSKMSGAHGAFEVNAKGHLIYTDLGSTNGSFLNNSLVAQTRVCVNDVIRIGNTIIKIDEKRLNSSERLSIGTSNPNHGEKTLPNVPVIAEDEEKKKRTVVLGKNIKSKKTVSNWAKAENVLDQEETGHTKFLKLDKKKKS